jgi:hypothetical protein
MTKLIYITHKEPGYHFWANAPAEVSFLRHPHRHLFTFRAVIEVDHDDRAYEFFIEQRKLQQLLDTFFNHNLQHELFFGQMSCEMIADQILEAMPHYTGMEVNEDDENGAILWRDSNAIRECNQREANANLELARYRSMRPDLAGQDPFYTNDYTGSNQGRYYPGQPTPSPFPQSSFGLNSPQVPMAEEEAKHKCGCQDRAVRLEELSRAQSFDHRRHPGHGNVYRKDPEQAA